MPSDLGEPGGSVVAEDPQEHPPVAHLGHLQAEQHRAANQTQGGPLSGLGQGLQGDAERAKQGIEALTGGKGQQRPPDGSQDGKPHKGPHDAAGLLGWAGRQAVQEALPPSVVKWLGMNPAYGDNPWLPIPQDQFDPVMMWQRSVRIGGAWRVLANPDLVSADINSIENQHSVQGAVYSAMLGLDDPAHRWIWENIMPQLLVAAADGNPVTGALDLTGQSSEDPSKALGQAWAALPWSDYAHVAQLMATDPGQVSLPLVASMFWKQFTAGLELGNLLPETGFVGKAGRGLLDAVGGGRMAFAFPGRRYVADAVKATRKLPTNPDVPPPDKLEQLARGIQALEPTVVRAARKAPAAAPASRAVEAPLVDLSSHLEQLRTDLAATGPTLGGVGQLLDRLRLLNVNDPEVKRLGAEFQQIRQADFTDRASYNAARKAKWDALLEALGKADATQVKLPAAIDFLGALDLATLPNQTMRELMDLSYEQTAAQAVRDDAVNQLERQQRQSMRRLFTGLFGREVLKQLEAQKIKPTEKLAQQLLPHLAPKMTAPQQAFLRAMWNKFADYDLRRLHPEDVTPRPLHEYLGEVSQASRPHAAQFIGTTHGILAFVQGGPHFLEDNPIEALVNSLLSRNRAQEAMLGEYFFPQMAALAEHGNVDMVEAMRALRDDAAFEKLSPEGKLVVDAWRQIQLLLRDRAMGTGFRSDFVGRFDPRVPVRVAEDAKVKNPLSPDEEPDPAPELPTRSGGGPIAGTTKAHRVEAIVQDPNDPSKVAIGEKYQDVFALNDAMKAAREQYVAQAVERGVDEAAALVQANQRYPLYHENLAFAAYEYLGRELRALNAHQAVQSLLHAWTEDGQRLAYPAAEARQAPVSYRSLRDAGRTYQNIVFHPQFADMIDKANRSIAPLDQGALEPLMKLGGEAKGLIMASPMVHAANVAGRVLPLFLTHPWAAFDELAGPVEKGLRGLDPQTRRMYRVMQAMQNGVVPHKAARDFFNNTMTALGNATGDSRMFEVPAGAEVKDAGKFIEDRAKQMPGLLGKIPTGPLKDLNDWFWRSVFAFQVLAYHVEQRGLAKRFPNMDPARVNMYAAFRANRWGGTIEPENWSQLGYQFSRLFMFAPNWLRSFLELQSPMYLRGELAASPELRGYVREQWIRSMVAMLAGQQITGNALNLLFSGHTTYQNQPQNRNRIEIDPTNPYSPGRAVYNALNTVDPGLVKDIDPDTGRNVKNGALLTWENPFARQEVQLEEATGLPASPFTAGDQTQPAALQTFAASHESPLLSAALQMALNLDTYATARTGFQSAQLIDPQGLSAAGLLPALSQLTPFGYSFGQAAQQAIQDNAAPPTPGQAPTNDPWRAWAQGLPLPMWLRDMVAAAPDSALKFVLTNALGVQTPYEKAATTQGTRLDSYHDEQLRQLQDQHHKVMAQQSADMMTGKQTPYQWRQWYQSYTPNYDGQLQAYYKGTSTYTAGPAGLYAQWQNLYNEAALPDGSGVDWGKLEQLQSDFTSKHTDAEMSTIKAYQSQQEQQYPALQMYREVTDNHRQQQQIWARQMGMTYSQLLMMLRDYGDIYGDRSATARFNAQHPQMQLYLRLNENWEVSNPYGQMYSLYYHTSAMRRWLAASGGETEEQGAAQLEREWHP